MSNELTFTERNDYTKRLHRLKKWKDDTLQSAIDLKHIRDTKSYREDHSTFEEFCEKELGIKKSRAYQLIDFAKQKQLGSEDENEWQSRNSKMSTAVDKIDRSEPKTVEAEIILCDKTEIKHPVPKEIINDWKRAEELGKDLLQRCSSLKVAIEDGKTSDDIIFRELSISSVAHVKNLYTSLKAVTPHAVCTSCQGRQAKKCTTCKGRGFFSKDFYDRAIPSEIKDLRNKANRK